MKIAVLYQALAAPERNGLKKPMKEGGYSDSGADIAYALRSNEIPVITPTSNPQIDVDSDWVFPDTIEGMKAAVAKGADTFWLNTVLYKEHPIAQIKLNNLAVVGQNPLTVDTYDHKVYTNNFLSKNGLPVPEHHILEQSSLRELAPDELNYPLVIKPILGRGSQGVQLVRNPMQLDRAVKQLFDSDLYGNKIYLEQYLEGDELTVSVMPPGSYSIDNQVFNKSTYWALPPVKRFNHINGIAPYSGRVAVVQNSVVMPPSAVENKEVQTILSQCIRAADLINPQAPIRIDCRASKDGKYYLFDVNLKPNMTGAARPHRMDQDSLTTMAAREIGWSYFGLLENILRNRWILGE